MSGADAGPPRGIDRRQLRVLLGAYLKLSLGHSARGFQALTSRPGAGSAVGALGFYVVFGLLVGVVAFEGPDVFTYALFLLGTTLFAVMSATSFVAADVLLSPEESDVLAPLPVSPATLLAAKAVNLAAFGVGIALAINLVPMFFGLATRGARLPWFPLAHALAAVLLALFCTGTVVLLYGLLMRFVPRARFERAATLGQIVLTFGIVGTTQLLPRLVSGAGSFTFRPALGWIAVLPITWFAALEEVLGGSHGDARLVALALGGCALTAAVFAMAVTRLAPAFGAGLRGLGEERARVPVRPAATAARGAGLEPVLRLWMRDPLERAAFRLVLAYMARDRETMMRLWPGAAALFLLPVLSLLGGRPDRAEFLFVSSLALAFAPIIAMEVLESSSHHAAAEVFRIAPLADASPLVHGARKAALAGLVLPVAAALFAAALVAGRGRPELAVGLVPGLLLVPPASLLPAAVSPYAPLSLQVRRGLQETRGLALLLPTTLVLIPVLFGARWAERHGLLAAFLAVELAAVVGMHAVLLRLARLRSRIIPREE